MTSGNGTADIILFNGAIAAPASGARAAQAIAVGDGRIRAVGTDPEVMPLAGTDTEKVDLEGRLVVPGFFDSHIHFYEWAMQRQGLALHDLAGLEHLLERVHQAAQHRQPGQWIT